MSRSGLIEMDFCDVDEILLMGRTRGRVASATRGKRGQAFLKTALRALDNMEDKRLAAHTFGVGDNGCMCFFTSLATETGRASVLTDVSKIDHEYDGESACHIMADAFDIAPVLAQDLVWDNDYASTSNPAERWQIMRNRVAAAVKQEATP